MNYQPVFVYGTLRPGQGNYRYLLADSAVRNRPAQVDGYALYGTSIPYAVPERGSVIHGSVVWIDPADYEEVLHDLDRLEGYRPDHLTQSHYVRVQRTATCPPSSGEGEVSLQVWMYEAGARFRSRCGDSPRIDGGDWVAARARLRTRVSR